ncbi:hypothetical protein WH47_00150 [Habropoda laboriosa]|uniref:Uncharacterized protein n=1 Tax=Habropoda laboriosa TaxID=597456 RepID=A0A0L7R8T4_9HYME|nr:hypothetical protein WH47_00150 [Habropoda laboriosa]
MYPWYRDSVAAAAAAGLGGPVGVVGSGFCSTGPGQGGTTIKTESGYSDCMLALDYVQSKVSTPFFPSTRFAFTSVILSSAGRPFYFISWRYCDQRVASLSMLQFVSL